MKKLLLITIALILLLPCAGMAATLEGVTLTGVSVNTIVIPPTSIFQFTITTLEEDDTFTLPIYNGGTYAFNVDWGDSSNDDITAYDDAAVTHTYEDSGISTYTVKITGTLTGWRFANAGDKSLIHDISSWGPLNFGNLASYFQGCSNLTISATDSPDLTGTINFGYAFGSCASLISPDLSAWDVSAVTDMDLMFSSSNSVANPNIGNWDTQSLTNTYRMFRGTSVTTLDLSGWNITALANANQMFSLETLTTATYDALLIGWEAQAEPANITFGAGNSVMTLGGAAEAARDALVANGWIITDSTGVHQTP